MHKGRACIAVLAVSAGLTCGCRTAIDTPRDVSAPRLKPETPIRLASASGSTRAGKERGEERRAKAEVEKEKIDLPTAIQLCTLQNFRLKASRNQDCASRSGLAHRVAHPEPVVVQ